MRARLGDLRHLASDFIDVAFIGDPRDSHRPSLIMLNLALGVRLLDLHPDIGQRIADGFVAHRLFWPPISIDSGTHVAGEVH